MKPYGCVAFDDDTHLIIYLSLFRHYFYALPNFSYIPHMNRTTMDKKEEKDRNNLDLFSLVYVCAISCRHKET